MARRSPESRCREGVCGGSTLDNDDDNSKLTLTIMIIRSRTGSRRHNDWLVDE